jgi:hypothetical protein
LRAINEGRQSPAERSGVLGAQVDLVLGAAEPESHRHIRRAAIKVVFERDGYLLCHPGLPCRRSVSCTVQDQRYSAVTATPFLCQSLQPMDFTQRHPEARSC